MFNLSRRSSLIVSVCIHALLAMMLLRGYVTPSLNARKGTVSVEYIESHPSGHELVELPEAKKNQNKHEGESQAKPQALSRENLSPNQSARSDVQGDPNGVTQGYSEYVTAITNLINRTKIYPKEAVDREEEGRILVSVTLSKDGSVLDLKIERPSTFDSLNFAALRAIRAIPKFPPLPPELGESVHLHIPLVYAIDR